MRLVLLGDPVEHSRSPAIHTAALRHLGIPGSYEARRVDEHGLAAACAELREGSLDGANVTMPHKQAAARRADELSPDAARAGAVNTLVPLPGGRLAGHLTDVTGIRTAWEEAGLPPTAPVLVLGAGGAAAAALLALEGRALAVAARRPDRAAALLRAVGVAGRVAGWGTPVSGAVVVNATPIGMRGEELPGRVVAAAAGLFEMAYGAGPTAATVAVRERELPVADGLDMLVAQAAASFELWVGSPAPAAVMRAALRGGMP